MPGHFSVEINISALPNDTQDMLWLKHAYVQTWYRMHTENVEAIRKARIDKLPEPKRMTRRNSSLEQASIMIAEEIRLSTGKSWRTRKAAGRPAGSTLGKWIHEFETNGQEPISLMDKYAKTRRKQHFTADQEMLMQESIAEYLRDHKTTMVKCHELLESKTDVFNAKQKAAGQPLIDLISLRTVQNRINAIPLLRRDVGRLGEEVALRRHHPASAGLDIVRPLERVEMDEHRLDLQTLLVNFHVWKTLNEEQRRKIKRLRLWVTVLIDVATRVILSIRVHSQKPSARTAISALELATCDRSEMARKLGCESRWDQFGHIEALAVDSATWLVGKALRQVATDMETTMFYPATGEPTLRGTIERLFSTMEAGAFTFFSGRTFGSIDEKGEYEPESKASVVASMATECLIRWAVDGYNNRYHAELMMSPADKWKELTGRFGVLPPPTGFRRTAIFGINIQRKVSRRGILHCGIYYNSKQLQRYTRYSKETEVLSRVNRHDLQAIEVLTDQGWINVRSEEPGLAGVSLWKFSAALDVIRAVGNRNAAINRKTFIRTIKYLHEQAEMARFEAEVDSPVLTDTDFERIETILDGKISFSDDTEEAPIDTEVEWGPSPQFFQLMGIQPAVFVQTKKSDPVDDPVRPDLGSRQSIRQFRELLGVSNELRDESDEIAPTKLNNRFDD